MKAVILCAGEGSRLRPLTKTLPKPLIKVGGQEILKHTLTNLKGLVNEAIIITKYKEEKFPEIMGNEFNGIKLTFHSQGEDYGTGAAIKNLELNENFLLINGDTIFSKKDFENISFAEESAVLVKEVKDPSKFGVFVEENGYAKEVVEKPSEFISNLASMGVYNFSPEIIDLCKKLEKSPRGEYEITDAINTYLKSNKTKLIRLKKDFIDITYPWNILDANNSFLSKLNSISSEGEIEEGVTIKGHIKVGKNSILKSGTYIEGNVIIGDNCNIGPNAYLRGDTVIGDNCHIGNAVEIKNTQIGDNTNVAHLSYIGDSVLGNNINIGGGFITGSLRHDGANIRCMSKGELVDTKRRKLGIIIGDNTKTGIKSSCYPGRVLDEGSTTLPGEIIK